VAEFVASLDGLFAGWSADLTTYFHEVNRMLQDSSRLDGSASAAQIRKSAVDLRAMEQTLSDFIAKVRSTVALIESPGLVASPVVSVMKAGLLQAAGFRERANELDQQVEQVLGNRLVDRIDETVRGLEEGRERRQRARMDTALAVVAAVGISGLGQIIQAGYDVRSLGAVWITLTVLGLAATFGLIVRWANRGARLHSRQLQAAEATSARAVLPKSRPAPEPGPRPIDAIHRTAQP
jgi:hypothetical protein